MLQADPFLRDKYKRAHEHIFGCPKSRTSQKTTTMAPTPYPPVLSTMSYHVKSGGRANRSRKETKHQSNAFFGQRGWLVLPAICQVCHGGSYLSGLWPLNIQSEAFRKQQTHELQLTPIKVEELLLSSELSLDNRALHLNRTSELSHQHGKLIQASCIHVVFLSVMIHKSWPWGGLGCIVGLGWTSTWVLHI